jgi:cytoskeleton protein RodZ
VAPTPVGLPRAENRVVLRQVKERQGQVLLNRVMRVGDTWTVPKGTQLVLSTGNAGGTELLLDGQAMPALGAFGSVRRDVMLDPDALNAASTARPPPQ